MATIKSYTDLEQSKKLAEILPLESADMIYTMTNGYHTPFIRIETIQEMDKDDVCAWSIAALLSIIPQEIFDGEYIINITEGCDNRWVLTYDHYENRNHSYYSLSIGADNLIDACVDMIERLHEFKML